MKFSDLLSSFLASGAHAAYVFLTGLYGISGARAKVRLWGWSRGALEAIGQSSADFHQLCTLYSSLATYTAAYPADGTAQKTLEAWNTASLQYMRHICAVSEIVANSTATTVHRLAAALPSEIIVLVHLLKILGIDSSFADERGRCFSCFQFPVPPEFGIPKRIRLRNTHTGENCTKSISSIIKIMNTFPDLLIY